MKLIVVGTGSSGNTYLLTNGGETLVVDAGLPFLFTKKAMNFHIASIKGVVVTHVHGDHHKAAHEYEAAGFPVWRAYESENRIMRYGGFTIQSFHVVHDVPCVGYLIDHADMGRLLYVTDTEYLKYRFQGVNSILIEANWSTEYVNRDDPKYKHVLTGHMELQTCLAAIKANTTENLYHIILCHLSSDNSDPNKFRKAAEEIAPPGCTVDVAEPGLVVDLGAIPADWN